MFFQNVFLKCFSKMFFQIKFLKNFSNSLFPNVFSKHSIQLNLEQKNSIFQQMKVTQKDVKLLEIATMTKIKYFT